MNNANLNTYYKYDQRDQGSNSRPNATNQSFSLGHDYRGKVFDWTGFYGDEGFINWIKACLSLRVCMTYLEPFVEETVERCYRKIRHSKYCEGFTMNEINALKQFEVGAVEWRLRIELLTDQIKRHTRSPGLVRGDAVPKMLTLETTGPWQMARLYMGDTPKNNLTPSTGQLGFKSFDYIDLVHYLERCKVFDEFSRDISRIRTILRWRNNLMHAPGYLISEKHLSECVETMRNVLVDPGLNAYLDGAPFAEQLDHIVRNPLSVVLGEMTRVPASSLLSFAPPPDPVKSESPGPVRKTPTPPPPSQPSTSSRQEHQETSRAERPTGYVARFKSMFSRLMNPTGSRSEPSLLRTFSNFLISAGRLPGQHDGRGESEKRDESQEDEQRPLPRAVVPGNSKKRPATSPDTHHLGCKLQKLHRK